MRKSIPVFKSLKQVELFDIIDKEDALETSLVYNIYSTKYITVIMLLNWYK